ncbi:cysteine proteinase inhibitor-like [Triticum dicoccoides]|uniref:cysteine proteinase inhibitor-like n=1 Tax=Triticum dicoccoides TaxID=85692 RepID=UPI000E7AE2FA|nr:cysteine proteinase inhibitor-like [Triticum dicoccoides]
MRKHHRGLGSVAAPALLLLLLLALVLPSTQTQSQKQSARETAAMAAEPARRLAGGIVESPGRENDLYIVGLARFAVSEHNKEANTPLELEKVVRVKEQAVAGRLYYITIQVDEGGAKKLYEAKVLEQLWLDVRKLVEFRPAEGASPNV